LLSTANFRPAIFLQGACESSHGLSDTLLSVTAVRTDEIGAALLSAVKQHGIPQPESAIRAVASR
jgi:lysine N6-hydroxylase/L-ornithine N5-oxygenase